MSSVKRALLVVLIVIAALPVAAYLVVRVEAERLTDVLMTDVDTFSRRHIERTPPPLSPAHQNGFACLGSMLDVTPRDLSPFSEKMDDLDAISAGKAPVPPTVAERAAALAAWARSLRECGHSAQLQYVDGVSPFAKEDHPRFKRWNVLIALGRLTTVELAQLLASGRPDGALELCTQTWPVLFDATHLGLLGAMLGVSGTMRLAPQCAAALAQATPPARQRAAKAWKDLGGRIARNAQVLEAERLLSSMLVFSWTGDAARAAALPARAEVTETGPLARLALGRLWGQWDRGLRRLATVADTPGPERAAAAREVDGLLDAWWVPSIAAGGSPDYEKFFVRLDELRAIWGLLTQLAEGGEVTLPTIAKRVEGGYELTPTARDPLFLAAPPPAP